MSIKPIPKLKFKDIPNYSHFKIDRSKDCYTKLPSGDCEYNAVKNGYIAVVISNSTEVSLIQ